MFQVSIQIKFDQPCLGNEWRDDPEPNRMLRGADGKVIFHPAWMKAMIIQAADAYSRHQGMVKKISWNAEIQGTLKICERPYTVIEQGVRVRRVKMHEGFDVGDVVEIRAFVPGGIPIIEFQELMVIAGRYCGLSPYGWKTGKFGRFSVVSVVLITGTKP